MDGTTPKLRPFTPRPLWPDDLSRLRMNVHPRVSHAEAVDVLRQSPGSSFWIPAVDEFVLVSPWRHRDELSTVHTFGAFGHEDALLRAAMQHAEESGRSGFVVVDINETRSSHFYGKHGLMPFEDIVTYSLSSLGQRHLSPIREDVQFRQVQMGDPNLLAEVVNLDHDAFPWFWWNSEAEFFAYLEFPGVEVWAMMYRQQAVAYAGITGYRHWGHLDRIAALPSLQGNGFGHDMLVYALRRLHQNGARSVALSTQGNNTQSRRLYQRLGFERTPQDDYGIHVASFNDAQMFAGMSGHRLEPLTGTG